MAVSLEKLILLLSLFSLPALPSTLPLSKNPALSMSYPLGPTLGPTSTFQQAFDGRLLELLRNSCKQTNVQKTEKETPSWTRKWYRRMGLL